MKHLSLTTPSFRYIEQGFTEWLTVLGYSWQGVYYMPLHVRELLYYLESKGKCQLSDITAAGVKDYYYNVLRSRTNHTQRAGALGSGSLNKHLDALKKFCEYLRQSGKLLIAELDIRQETVADGKPTVLTEMEVQQLYDATAVPPDRHCHGKSTEFYEVLGMRDRALLTIFYGCGLRRNEGHHLNTEDIHLESGIVHVRKGKGYKERIVPVSKAGVHFLSEYLYEGRPRLLSNPRETALFISHKGNRLGSQMLWISLKYLVKRTENHTLILKDVGLHTLRHSIATHLLAGGMSLERIKEFLGHSSLDSTQIYTHLLMEDHGTV